MQLGICINYIYIYNLCTHISIFVMLCRPPIYLFFCVEVTLVETETLHIAACENVEALCFRLRVPLKCSASESSMCVSTLETSEET